MKSLSSHTKRRWSLLLTAFCTVWLGLAADGFGAGFIKFDGVDGEATEQTGTDWIDISNINHKLLRSIMLADERENGAIHRSFTITKEVDKATPKLIEFCITGNNIQSATLEIEDMAENPFIWKRIVFKNVMITSYNFKEADDRPTEEIAFVYEKIHWHYFVKPIPGQSSEPVHFGWDLIADTPYYPEGVDPPTPTPTQIPTIDPTPTPTIDPTLPTLTPTPIIEVPTATPTPILVDGGDSITLQGDFFRLMDDRFTQKSVEVQNVKLPPLEPNIREMHAGQFYPIIILPDGTVFTAIKSSNLPSLQESFENDDNMVLVMINNDGQLIPYAEKIIPDVLVEEEALQDTETVLLNFAYREDTLKIMLLLRGFNPTDFDRVERLIITTIEGPFDATMIQNFQFY